MRWEDPSGGWDDSTEAAAEAARVSHCEFLSSSSECPRTGEPSLLSIPLSIRFSIWALFKSCAVSQQTKQINRRVARPLARSLTPRPPLSQTERTHSIDHYLGLSMSLYVYKSLSPSLSSFFIDSESYRRDDDAVFAFDPPAKHLSLLRHTRLTVVDSLARSLAHSLLPSLPHCDGSIATQFPGKCSPSSRSLSSSPSSSTEQMHGLGRC